MEEASGRRMSRVKTDLPTKKVGSDLRGNGDLHEGIFTKNRQADNERKHTHHQVHKRWIPLI